MSIDKKKWDEKGFLLYPQLLERNLINSLLLHFDETLKNSKTDSQSIINKYRIIKPESYSKLVKKTMLHSEIKKILRELFEAEPLAAQTMFYYKPPGTLGQGIHWDNYYVEADPKPCIGVWIALDQIDETNGGIGLIPGSHKQEHNTKDYIANTKNNTGNHCVKIENSKDIFYPKMEIGDVVVFHGNILHGSPPNKDQKRWRRSLACHYISSCTKHICQWYLPLIDFDGGEVIKEKAEDKREIKGNDWKIVTSCGWK